MSKQDNRVRMQNILEDTIEYYSDDPSERRATDLNGACQYTDADGNHCAVGRYMRVEFQTTEFYGNNGTSVGSLAADLDTYLESNVLGLTQKFWSALQDIHDGDGNWNDDTGLSERGKHMYNSLKNKIDAGGYS